MGLFNSGRNGKAEKVNKSERHEIVSPSKSHRRPSKHPQNNFVDVVVRPASQFPFMQNANLFQGGSFGFPQSYFANYPQFKFPYSSNSPFDLSKYGQSSYPFAAQTPATAFSPLWFNGISQFNDRSPYQQQQQQQPLNLYQQNGWSYPQQQQQWSYPYYQPYNF
jgi:hypothetical protein